MSTNTTGEAQQCSLGRAGDTHSLCFSRTLQSLQLGQKRPPIATAGMGMAIPLTLHYTKLVVGRVWLEAPFADPIY